MARPFHVAILIETSRQYGRELLRGVVEYQREARNWISFFQPHAYGDPPPDWLKSWRGDGILARIVDQRTADAVLQHRVPTIDLRGSILDLGIPHIRMDNQQIVRLAVSHLRDCGYRHFGFCSLPENQNRWIDERRRLFQESIEAAEQGATCDVLMGKRGQDKHASLKNERSHIAHWIKALPKPIGIMAANDDIGQQVIDACASVNIRVPEEVGVIGVDNDEFLCNLSHPQLTSIDLNLSRLAYRAAAMLDRLMSDEESSDQSLLCYPKLVVARASTDVYTYNNRELTEALAFIRRNACDGITVDDVVRHVDISRRVIERRFHDFLHRTPKDEITRVRLEVAKKLLAETNLSLNIIAERIGLQSASHFCQLFRNRIGITPARFREFAKR